MNATNRGANRAVLLIVGIGLLAIGAAAMASALVPDAGETWRRWAAAGTAWLVGAHRDTRISEATTASWLAVGVLAALALVVVVVVILIARLGGGRSTTVIREEPGEGARGSVTIRPGFASDALTRSLASRDEILAVRVQTRRAQGADVLHVSVTPRQNVSPGEVAETTTRAIDRLSTLLGRETPALVSIRSGLRSRIAADRSRVD